MVNITSYNLFTMLDPSYALIVSMTIVLRLRLGAAEGIGLIRVMRLPLSATFSATIARTVPNGFNALSDFTKLPISTIYIVHQLELLIVIIRILGTMP